MREMGFNYNPSTAGSSVRFNPPDPRDKVCQIAESFTLTDRFLSQSPLPSIDVSFIRIFFCLAHLIGSVTAHPDPTLQPIMVKEFAKRLKRQYGWTGEDFIKQAS